VEFNELSAPSLKDLFIKEITENILSGKLKTGEKLPNEREMAEKMRVSRAVINGGLSALSQQGFVEIVPRKGAFVADYKRRGRIETLRAVLEYSGGRFDPVMMKSIYEVRTCVERHIARLAARRRTAKDIAGLRSQLKLISQLDEPRQLAGATHEFYHLLSVASGNIIYPLNIEAYKVIYIPLMEALYRQLPKEDRLVKLAKLVDAIEAKNPTEAANRVTDIINWGLRAFGAHYRPGDKL
jgi:DNA-binding FadR family transcriptional regulator